VKLAKSLTGHSIIFFEKLFISGYQIYYSFQIRRGHRGDAWDASTPARPKKVLI